jgi:RNA polymerase sigma factor (sigma-70 family)
MDILALLSQYEPLLWKLASNPLHSMARFGAKKFDLKLSKDEIEDMFDQLTVEFVDLCNSFDSTKGVDFEGYIQSKLGWRACNLAKKIANERKIILHIDDIEAIEEEMIDYRDNTSEEVSEALKTLPLRQKQVIELHILRNQSVNECARILGIRKQEVIRHRGIALSKLKNILKNPPL